MKNIFFLLLICGSTLKLSAQEITQKESFMGTVYYQNGEKISRDNLYLQLRGEERSASLARRAQNNGIAAIIFSIPGGFAIGYPIGYALAGGEFRASILVGGLALTVIGGIFDGKSERLLSQSIDKYNAGLSSSSQASRPPVYFSLVSNHQGLGISFNF